MSELLDDLAAVSRFGGEGTGLTRIAWTRELRDAYDWAAGRMHDLGLEVEIDAAGNLIGRWEAGEGPAVLAGSHLDSVPSGGRFDGTLGVLSAIHAVRLLRARGVRPRRPIWIAAWMDEEAYRFSNAMLGSRAFCGEDLSGWAALTDRDGVALADAMAAWDRPITRVRDAARIGGVGCYLELHIEQGPLLERSGTQIGIVSGIVSALWFRVRLVGQANHAGTTPMELRRDAGAGAARVLLALREAARARPGLVANVGHIAAEPGAFNIVPGACEFSVDVRIAPPGTLDDLEGLVRDTVAEVAAEESLQATLTETFRAEGTAMHPAILDAIGAAADAEGASHVVMPSGAGHDAMFIGRHVPSGMLFVPSRGGVSHSPDEHTDDDDCERGARVLARAIEDLATRAVLPSG